MKFSGMEGPHIAPRAAKRWTEEYRARQRRVGHEARRAPITTIGSRREGAGQRFASFEAKTHVTTGLNFRHVDRPVGRRFDNDLTTAVHRAATHMAQPPAGCFDRGRQAPCQPSGAPQRGQRRLPNGGEH
jgi:hypothetical protein